MSTDQFELREASRLNFSPEQTTIDNYSDPTPVVTAPNAAAHDIAAPDGGYGWVAVFGCAVLTWWFVGTTYSWGVIQAALVEEGLSEASTLSFVGSLTVACIAFLAVANARIISGMGAQKLGFLGITLLGLGDFGRLRCSQYWSFVRHSRGSYGCWDEVSSLIMQPQTMLTCL